MQDSWIKAFENTRLVKMGGMCFECCDYEDMVDDMKAFISQVEKDAIEKTNKRWRERVNRIMDEILAVHGANATSRDDNKFYFKNGLDCVTSIIKWQLSDLLEDKK